MYSWSIQERKAKKAKSFALVIQLGWNEKKKRYDQKWISLSGAKSKKEAESMAVRIMAEMDMGTFIDAGKMTMKQLFSKFLDEYCVVTNKAPQTVEGYQSIIQKHLIPAFGHILITKLEPSHLVKYYAANKDKLSSTTLLQHHRIIQKALNYAISIRLLKFNVAQNCPHPTKNKTQVGRALTEPEIIILLQALEKARTTNLYLPCLLSLWTGLRVGEVLGLRWADIRLTPIPAKLTVTQSLQRTKDRGQFFGPPKGEKSNRTLFLPDPLLNALMAEKKKQAKNRLQFGPIYQTDLDLVCCKEDGSPLKRGTISKRFGEFIKKIGLRVRFHDLRHSHGTILAMAGVPEKDIRDYLGHSSVAVTDIYTHVLPSMREEDFKKLNSIAKNLTNAAKKETTEERIQVDA